MHIPDNYLSPQTDGVLFVAMVPAWLHCARVVRQKLDARHLSFLGMASAFSFLLMMFNVPLPGGTTGHAVGGTLVALMLGPEAACLAVSVALALQALLFGDGGVLAFGANCFNMAVILPFVGCAIYRLIAGSTPSGMRRRIATALGAYVGLNAAALCAAVEFGLQPLLFSDAAGAPLYCPYPLSVSVPAMMIPHLLVAGVIEAVATVAILEFVQRVAPDYLVGPVSGAGDKNGEVGNGSVSDSVSDAGAGAAMGTASGTATDTASAAPVLALLAVLVVATPLGLLAQGTAWGEWSADELAELAGLSTPPAGMAQGFSFEAMLPDYSLAGLPDWVAYIMSAIIGVLVLVIVFKLFAASADRRVRN